VPHSLRLQGILIGEQCLVAATAIGSRLWINPPEELLAAMRVRAAALHE